jgi:type II secretory pathway pseudopilin PulG
MLVLILIALAVAAPKIAESIRRDKEIETVHRGMQYARAIQVYYNKFGRYPTTIDQLVKTDNQRFLRKRYLNPMTGKDDWRIIHYGEQRVPTMGLFGQAVQQQAGMTPGVNNGTTASNGLGSSSPLGSSGSGIGGNNSPVNSSPSGSSSGGFPAFGTTPQTLTFTGDSTTDTANDGSSTPTTGSSNSSGSGIGSTGSSTSSGASSGFGSSSSFGGATTSGAMGSTPIGGTQTTGGSNSAFGTPGVSVGAPIIGVGLLSKKTSIKIYKKQTHYNQWEFIYDPNQNVMAAAGGVGGATNGTNGGSASSFGSGSSSGFGSNNGSGFGSSSGAGSGSNNGPGFGSNNGSTFGSSPTSPTSPTNNSPQ